SRIPPASWLVARDVIRARGAMNLSEWSTREGSSAPRAAATLLAACADVRSGRMPLKGYRLLHPESRLSQVEIDAFCGWATSESQRLFAKKKPVKQEEKLKQ